MSIYKFIIHREEMAVISIEADNNDDAMDILWERYTDGEYNDEFEEVQTYVE